MSVSSLLLRSSLKVMIDYIGKNSLIYFSLHWVILHGVLYNIINQILDESLWSEYWWALSPLLCILQLMIITPLVHPINRLLKHIK